MSGIVKGYATNRCTGKAHLKRAEVAFVQKRRQEWWECPNQFCGARILFRLVGPPPFRIDPTCFCGSTMVPAMQRQTRSNESHRTRPSDSPGRECGSTQPPPGRRGQLHFDSGQVRKGEIYDVGRN